jgi:predicted nucleotidyltransferase
VRREEYFELADLCARRLADSLKDRLEAVMVSGSLATGDLVPGESDLDLIIILNRKCYADVDVFEEALTTISGIHEEMTKAYPLLNWHGPRIYNEETYVLIDHDHEHANKILYSSPDFVPERFLARRDYCIRMTMRRLFTGSRGCAIAYDPKNPGELWDWLRFHFLTTSCYFLTMKGYTTSKRKALTDIERLMPTTLVQKACQILKDPDKEKAPSQDDFWALVAAVEEIAQDVFHEAR